MNKKHKAVLLGTMITLALQTGSAYAEKVPEKVYEEYVEFGTDKETDEKNKGTATISLDGSDNKDKIFTFEKGATIDGSKLLVDSWNEREKDNAAIINTHDLDKKLIINVGSEKESENNYNFNVIGKTEKELNLNNYSTNIYNEGSISLNTKNTDINLKINSNSKEDKGRSFHITTVGESDLIIDGNNNSNLYLSGTINQSSIQIDDDSSVEIKNLNNFIITDSLKDTSSSAISLHPVFIGENPSLKIENVKNFIINPDADMTEKVDGVYLGGGIYAHSGQVNIDVDEFRIGDEITSFDNEEKIKLGTGITVNSADVNISVKNDLNINSVSTGIKFWYVYDKYKPILNLSANSLKIKAVDHDIEEQSQFTSNLYNSNGTAFYLTGYTGNKEGTTPTITTTNEMILYGDNNGILSVHPRINIDMKSINKSIYVIGKKEHGIFKNDNDSTLKIEADQNVNIFGGKYGIRLMDTENNTVYIKTETDDINIISDKEGIRSDMMFNVLDFESPINNETFEANGNLNIYGKEIGINYLMGAGKAEFISHEGNIQINGDKIAFNSNSILQVPDTDEDWENMGYGHVGNKTFEVRSEKGNVIVGDVPETLDDNINNEQGIAFSGRATLNIDGANTVWIGANKEAIDIDKAIVSNIHGKNIIIQSKDGTAINQEGMNSLTLGYDNISDKMTENIAIKGNIGMSLIANKKGTDDIIEEVKDLYPEGADNTIVGDTNKTILNANNVDIIGKDYGIKMSQDATDMRQERDNNIVDFVNRWRNGVLAINAKENIDILATEGTAIDVDGVNKIAINNSYNNKVVGNKTGINLNLSTKIPLNLKEQIKEYKDNSVKAYIRDEYSGIEDSIWNGNLANSLRSELDEAVKKIGQKIGKEYEDFNAFYEDLFKNPIYQENPELVEPISLVGVINKMNPEGDPLQEYVKATGIFEAIGLDVNNLYEYTYGDYLIGIYIYANAECNSIEECYDKLVSEGKFEGINTNIDVENSFKLTTGVEGVNTIIGGEKALNADGQVNAFIKGGSNIISNYSVESLSEDNKTTKDNSKYAIYAGSEANIDIEATNGSNIIQSKGTAIYATDKGTTIDIKNTSNSDVQNAQTLIIAVNEGVLAKDLAKINIDGENSDVNVLAGNKAVWATGNGGDIDITGKTVNVTALGNGDGNIAIVAGLEKDNTDDRSTIDINTTGYETSVILGDIIGARNGDVNINSKARNTSQGNLFVKGDILSGNGGSVNVNLGNGGYFEGRTDDYQDAGRKEATNNTFFDPHFTNGEVSERGQVNLNFGKNSIWKVTGQSWASTVQSDNALIDLTTAESDRKEAGHALTIENLEGNTNFKMHLDGQRNNSDMIYIKKASGSYNVFLDDIVTEEDIGETGLRFMTTDDTVSNLKVNRVSAAVGGLYNINYLEGHDEYQTSKENDIYNGTEMTDAKPGMDSVDDFLEVKKDKNNSSITLSKTKETKETKTPEKNIDATNHKIIAVKERIESDVVRGIEDSARVNYNMGILLDRLNKRLGEARYIDGDEGLWIRMWHKNVGRDNQFETASNMYQIGYDKFKECDNGKHRQGVAIDYMDADSNFKDIIGNGETNRKGIWLYDTWLGDKGHYADYVFKWGHLENKFNLIDELSAKEINAEYNNNAYALSAEYGRKKMLNDEGWYIEPQTQLQYTHLTGADYQTNLGTNVSMESVNSLIGRVGFRLGKDIDDDKKSTFYVKADILHEFMGDQEINAYDKTGILNKTYENEGTWYDIGIGFSTMLSDTSYAYLDYERCFGNNNKNTYQINGGIRWTL